MCVVTGHFAFVKKKKILRRISRKVDKAFCVVTFVENFRLVGMISRERIKRDIFFFKSNLPFLKLSRIAVMWKHRAEILSLGYFFISRCRWKYVKNLKDRNFARFEPEKSQISCSVCAATQCYKVAPFPVPVPVTGAYSVYCSLSVPCLFSACRLQDSCWYFIACREYFNVEISTNLILCFCRSTAFMLIRFFFLVLQVCIFINT